MSIPTYQELRRALDKRANKLTHPTKGTSMEPHKYGSVVYFEGGHVGLKANGKYYIAEGEDHQDSVMALAHELGITSLDPGVTVNEVDGGHFWLRCATGK
jgi:hypothetical protein